MLSSLVSHSDDFAPDPEAMRPLTLRAPYDAPNLTELSPEQARALLEQAGFFLPASLIDPLPPLS